MTYVARRGRGGPKLLLLKDLRRQKNIKSYKLFIINCLYYIIPYYLHQCAKSGEILSFYLLAYYLQYLKESGDKKRPRRSGVWFSCIQSGQLMDWKGGSYSSVSLG